MIQYGGWNLLLTLYSAYPNLWWVDDCFISRLTSLCWLLNYRTCYGDLGTGLFIRRLNWQCSGRLGGASRIDATSGAVLYPTAFSVAQGIKPIAICIAVPMLCSLDYADHPWPYGTTPLHTVLMRRSNALIIKGIGNATTFLKICCSLEISPVPFQSSWLLLWWSCFCQSVVDFVASMVHKRLDSCRTYASWSWICDLASLLA